MLGRLFNSSSPSKDPFPDAPISALEDGDTRNLLYGSSEISPDMSADLSAKNLRAVVLTDVHFFEDYVYDSNKQAMASRQSPPTRPGVTRQFSGTRQSSSGSQIHLNSQQGAPQSLPLPVVKELLFGPTPIKFTNCITKLHCLPNDGKSSRTTWIVSRLFKVGGALDHVRTTILPQDKSPPSLLSTSQSSVCSLPEPSKETPAEDPNPWTPCATLTTNDAQLAQDIRCGICIFFSLPGSESEAHGILTNHWEELSCALADLQSVVFNRVCDTLPPAMRDYRMKMKACGGYDDKKRRSHYSLDGDDALRIGLECFRSRFLGAVMIPRVICGQNRWAELVQEIKLLQSKLDCSNNDDAFLSTAIASFIKCNSRLVRNPGSGVFEHPPTRTIVVGNNRISTRRLIFILSSLIKDQSAEKLNKQLEQIPGANLNNNINNNSTTSTLTNKAMATTIDSCDCSSGSSPASKSTANFTSTEKGWEIPNQTKISENTAACVVPHVIRPSFSQSSLSTSLSTSYNSTRSRHPSKEGLRKGASFLFGAQSGSFTNSGGSSSSFFSSLWNSSRSESGSFTSTSSAEDFPYYFEGDYTGLSSSLPSKQQSASGRPMLSRWHSSERTATTLSPSLNLVSDSMASSVTEDAAVTFQSDTAYELVEDGAGNAILDVEMPELEPIFEPIVLPPIAGHIPDFHPDFAVQAVPLNRDIEEKIARAMLKDAEGVPIPKWVHECKKQSTESLFGDGADKESDDSSEFSVMSRSLIINLRNREVYEWALSRTCTKEGCHQLLSRKKLYSKRPSDDYLQLHGKVHSVLKDVTGKNSGACGLLEEAFQSAFGLL
ncbi:hypothetical protein TRVA0_004S02674 [Trichomonascus vanleenenianus]|uniref:uncharacterized protein n=1 Tax=Trichomonascus vanleenenianus TaxID=2268995 RepID=UPI003ECB68E3